MNIKEQSVIEYLSNCSGRELIEVLGQSLRKRPENGVNPDEYFVERRLVLAEASRILEDDDKVWSNWEICLVADMNPTMYERTFEGEPFLQEGKCDQCDVKIASHVKGALCPLCGNEVWLT